LHANSGLSYSDDIDTFSLEDLELFIQTNTQTAGVEEQYQKQVWQWLKQIITQDQTGIDKIAKFRETK